MLKGIKLVAFDFDDTLCIHEDHIYNDKAYRAKLLKGEDVFANANPSVDMLAFMDRCVEADIPMFLCSAVGYSLAATAKLEYVLRVYGYTLGDICVSSWKKKTPMLKTVSEVYGIKPEEILIVDDYWKVLGAAAKAGFKTATPMQVVNWIQSEEYWAQYTTEQQTED